MGEPEPYGSDQDEVDRIVAAWRRERPDLDVAPLEVLSRVSRLARHLDLARRTAFAGRGLESWEFDVLSALRRAGEPYRLTPTQLVRQTLVTSGTMTHRIARLVDRGLVERTTSEADLRSVLVRLTPAGRDVVDGALEELVAGEREILAALPTSEQADVAAVLKRLLRPFDDR
ncbi:MAG TPA: MarR family transcriptional regulator [Ornithinimicrobium sp.]|nr:MarR family transcriptional regulator [Ornithinimicrobium sp.]